MVIFFLFLISAQNKVVGSHYNRAAPLELPLQPHTIYESRSEKTGLRGF